MNKNNETLESIISECLNVSDANELKKIVDEIRKNQVEKEKIEELPIIEYLNEILEENAECICSFITSKYMPRCNREQKKGLKQILKTIHQYALGIMDVDEDNEYYDYENQEYYPKTIYYYCYEFDFKKGTISNICNNDFKYLEQKDDFSSLYLKLDTFGVSIKYGLQKIFMPFNDENQYQGMPTKKELENNYNK